MKIGENQHNNNLNIINCKIKILENKKNVK